MVPPVDLNDEGEGDEVCDLGAEPDGAEGLCALSNSIKRVRAMTLLLRCTGCAGRSGDMLVWEASNGRSCAPPIWEEGEEAAGERGVGLEARSAGVPGIPPCGIRAYVDSPSSPVIPADTRGLLASNKLLSDRSSGPWTDAMVWASDADKVRRRRHREHVSSASPAASQSLGRLRSSLLIAGREGDTDGGGTDASQVGDGIRCEKRWRLAMELENCQLATSCSMVGPAQYTTARRGAERSALIADIPPLTRPAPAMR